MSKNITFVGLDVHQETIVAAILHPRQKTPQIARFANNEPRSDVFVRKLTCAASLPLYPNNAPLHTSWTWSKALASPPSPGPNSLRQLRSVCRGLGCWPAFSQLISFNVRAATVVSNRQALYWTPRR